jgi:hypothetical protein
MAYDILDRKRKFLEDLNLMQLAESSQNQQIGVTDSTTTGIANPADIEEPSMFKWQDLMRGAISGEIGTVGPKDIYSAKVSAGSADKLPESLSIVNEKGQVVHQGERSSRNLDEVLSKLNNPELNKNNQFGKNFQVIKSSAVPDFLSRFRDLTENQAKILSPIGEEPNIFTRVTSGVQENLFGDAIINQIEEIRGTNTRDSSTGRLKVQPSKFYDEKFKLDLPDVPFEAYSQGEFAFPPIPVTYEKLGKWGENLSRMPLSQYIAPQTRFAGEFLNKSYFPLVTFVKKSMAGSENQRISKTFLDQNVLPKIPGTDKTDQQNINDMLFWEEELNRGLEQAILKRDKIINTKTPLSKDAQQVNQGELEALNQRISELPIIILRNRALLAQAYEQNIGNIRKKINYGSNNTDIKKLQESLDTSGINNTRKKLKKREF